MYGRFEIDLVFCQRVELEIGELKDTKLVLPVGCEMYSIVQVLRTREISWAGMGGYAVPFGKLSSERG